MQLSYEICIYMRDDLSAFAAALRSHSLATPFRAAVPFLPLLRGPDGKPLEAPSPLRARVLLPPDPNGTSLSPLLPSGCPGSPESDAPLPPPLVPPHSQEVPSPAWDALSYRPLSLLSQPPLSPLHHLTAPLDLRPLCFSRLSLALGLPLSPRTRVLLLPAQPFSPRRALCPGQLMRTSSSLPIRSCPTSRAQGRTLPPTINHT